MSQRIYVDANVFINFLYEESTRPDLVEASVSVLDDVIGCRFFLVVSDFLIREISKVTGLSYDVVESRLFEPYRMVEKLEFVKLSQDNGLDVTAFSSGYGVHPVDAVHAVLAENNGCWLVTFDGDLKVAAGRAGFMVFDPRDLL